jgi:hypothetical protein
MSFRILFCIVAFAGMAACTPVRSKLPPPYALDGKQLSAPEMARYAEDWCTEAQGKIQLPPHPFTTDGCSASPDSRWQSCCLQHDVEYWCGAGDRRTVDASFRSCMFTRTNKVYANLAWMGVRLGGGRFMPFPWRFGYGSPWPHRKSTVERMNNVVVDSESSPQTPPTSR